MKRLRIISSVNPRHGGPIEGIRQQIPHHLAAGIEEHVVTLDAPDAPWVRDFPIPLHACGEPGGTTPAWKRLLPWRRYGYQPGFVPWLRAHIHEYDLVIGARAVELLDHGRAARVGRGRRALCCVCARHARPVV